jgi:3-oxoacid CoA-transferase subunit A
MAILFSGDFHANSQSELSKITKREIIARFGGALFDEIKYHIILGDGGFQWPGNERGDDYNYLTLAVRPFPILCVIGNHEPILGRTDLHEVDIGIGNAVYQINDIPFVAYLKRGKIYTLDGYQFLVLGGALSIDKFLRTPNKNWWHQEYWSDEEKEAVMQLLEGGNTFDYVLSHTGPDRINRLLFTGMMGKYADKFSDEVALLNDTLDEKIACKEWFCGHWHKDKHYYDETLKRGYQYLYDKLALLKDGEVIIK